MAQVSQITPHHPSPVSRRGSSTRWRIWNRQLDEGRIPCFRTAARFFCHDTDCPLREECLSLRAAWRR